MDLKKAILPQAFRDAPINGGIASKGKELELASSSVSTIPAAGNQSEPMIRVEEGDFAIAKYDVGKKAHSRPNKNDPII